MILLSLKQLKEIKKKLPKGATPGDVCRHADSGSEWVFEVVDRAKGPKASWVSKNIQVAI